MAKDKYHEAVRNALIKDGWTIIHDPFILKKKEAKLIMKLIWVLRNY
jgi:XisH protein